MDLRIKNLFHEIKTGFVGEQKSARFSISSEFISIVVFRIALLRLGCLMLTNDMKRRIFLACFLIGDALLFHRHIHLRKIQRRLTNFIWIFFFITAAATMSLDEDKSDQIGLATMPVEVLELIFSFVDDTNLLAVSQVCKRFVPIAKHVFEQKYASRSYRMYFVEKKVNHRAILKKFGGKLSGMDINKVDMLRKNRWVLNVIRENATTLNKLALSSIDVDLTWMLACLQNLKSCELAYLNVRDSSWAALALQPLKHIEMVELRGLSDEILVEFFDNNRQLESLSFYSYQLNVLDKIHDRLHMLKHLQVEFAITEDYPSELNIIKLDSLESLDVRFIDYEYSVDNNDVSRVLQAFRNGCTNINQLSVQCHQNSAADDVLTTIYAFDKLKSLDISDVELTSKQLTSLQRKLPNLNAIKVTMVFPFEIDGEDLNQDMIVNEILSILSNSPHLNELSIKISLEDVSVDCFNYDFFTRFSLAIENNRNDIKLNLHSYSWNVFVSRNKIMHKLNHSKPVLIHWTGYEADRSISEVRMSDFNEKNLWSLFDRMEPADLYALQQTSQNMESKVTKYAEENFKHRLLRFSRLDQTFQGLIKHFVKVELKIRGDEWSIIDLAQLPHLESLKITSQKPIAVDSTVSYVFLK